MDATISKDTKFRKLATAKVT